MRRFGLATVLILAASLAPGQTWVEDGDAPDLLTGQITVGPGVLTTISGTLTSGSDVDLYAIQIDDPAGFSAKTCGLTSIDSCLYLFDENGNGVSMSEDGCGAASWITSQFVTAPGRYYLAMSAYDYDPRNAGGLEIWNDTPWGTERAPDGPGAPGPLASWAGSAGGSGAYSIALTGASFAQQGPPPPTGACCYGEAQCVVVTVSGCASLGGAYYGDNTSCTPNPCPPPLTGACCFATAGCLELTAARCAAAGGTYQGDGSPCWPNPCVAGPPGGGWSDNFDSYADGTYLYNVGGWTGWDNDPAAAGTVTSARYRSAPHSIVVNDTADAIHPFTNFDGGRWTIRAWQYIPSGLSGATYFIVNSYYQHNGPYFWTVELHFDPATGRVKDALRDPSGTSTLPILYDQWVEIRIEVDFTTTLGTVHEYYNDQLLYTGDWIVGAVGQLQIGNIDLYAPHATPVYYDDLSVVPATTPPPTGPQRPLFTGVQYGSLPTRTTNLAGFPNVTWQDGFVLAINGAAGRPDGAVYMCGEDFSHSPLYLAPLEGPPVLLCNTERDLHALAYGRGRLFGYSNWSSPRGIYEINPLTGAMTLLVATDPFLFFALDYNAADGKLYGYTEYGTPRGLKSIDIDTGVITHVAGSVPSSNSAARGLACGYNKVYALTVYGAENPMFVYDLAQGPGGTWTPMTHPYPESNSTNAAAWAPGPVPGDLNCDGRVDLDDIDAFVLALSGAAAYNAVHVDCYWRNADCNLDGAVNFDDIDPFVALIGSR